MFILSPIFASSFINVQSKEQRTPTSSLSPLTPVSTLVIFTRHLHLERWLPSSSFSCMSQISTQGRFCMVLTLLSVSGGFSGHEDGRSLDELMRKSRHSGQVV
ncbi:hypothetical protein RND81_14G187400 [Saponaria officinalis]|uniref:Uncharacterized protein n=1 Tax=Saponaria officinalis TaxID=3572 RepID=A0AAW1GS79_SAPOF